MANRFVTLFVLFIYALAVYIFLEKYRSVEKKNVAILTAQGEPSFSCTSGFENGCIRPFRTFPNKFRYSNRYELAACVIEKSMSTMLAAIMCLLYDPEAYHSSNRSLHMDTYKNRLCKDKNELTAVKNHLEMHPDTTLIAVVREPIDRFLSGYVDKCIKEAIAVPTRCYSCRGNMSCFIHKQYERMFTFSTTKSGISFEDVHFNPQNWHCNFRDSITKYQIIHYGSCGDENARMVRQIQMILKVKQVPQSLIDEITTEISVAKTPHATVSSLERQRCEEELRSRPDLMKMLLRMFYFDYILFGFPLPTIPV